jgi:hypothetical protein
LNNAPGVTVTYRGYAERDLVKNRSSLLIYGATEADRRAWAEVAASHFVQEGPLRVAQGGPELRAALDGGRGVLYVPDVTLAGDDGQVALVRALREREERPKLVLGLPASPDTLRASGRLRPDLQYSLQMAQVNMETSKVRAKAPAARKAPPRKAAAPRKPAARKPAARKAAAPKAPPRKSASRRRS